MSIESAQDIYDALDEASVSFETGEEARDQLNSTLEGFFGHGLDSFVSPEEAKFFNAHYQQPEMWGCQNYALASLCDHRDPVDKWDTKDGSRERFDIQCQQEDLYLKSFYENYKPCEPEWWDRLEEEFLGPLGPDEHVALLCTIPREGKEYRHVVGACVAGDTSVVEVSDPQLPEIIQFDGLDSFQRSPYARCVSIVSVEPGNLDRYEPSYPEDYGLTE